MTQTLRRRAPLVLLLVVGCSRAASPGSSPAATPRNVALPDTLVCVVDRTTERGLRHLTAKRTEAGRVMVMVSGKMVPLEQVHPVNLIAGYAGGEPWFASGEPITLESRRYRKVSGERRIQMERLTQGAEFRAIPLYIDPEDQRPPQAVYAPVRPGCIFQAYVREDLIRD